MPSTGMVDGRARCATVCCAQWPVVAAGCAADEAVAVLHAQRVVARSTAAAQAGVRLGQRRREAQACCPSVRLVGRDLAVEARAFRSVVDAVAEIVPRLELSVPGVLGFAARGPSRYFGGEAAMAALVVDRVRAVLGPAAVAAGVGMGVADGRFAAAVAARRSVRTGQPELVGPGGSAGFLADLPVRLLVDVGGLDAETVGLFARLGLGRLGAVAAMDVADLVGRFGAVGAAAWQMAAGADDRPLGAVDPPAGSVVEHRFDTPVGELEAVVFTARSLAEQLVARLAGQGQVCTQLAVVLDSERGVRHERLWSHPLGLGVAAIVERVRWQCDGWARLGGDDAVDGVVAVRLEPTEARADDGAQAGLWGGRSEADVWAERGIARLAGLLGDDRVVMAERRGGRLPGDRHRWVPASLAVQRSGAPPTVDGPWPGGLPQPSPAEVLDEPRPLEVLDAAGRMVAVSARGALSGAPVSVRVGDGAPEPIDAWAGPWPLEERWWDPGRHRRHARFQLLTAAGDAYLAVVERQQWWLLAIYS